MKLLIASNNANKVREIKQILTGYFDEMATMKEAGLDIDVVEDGETFRDNAIKKATEILEKSGFDAALADDTGLCVDALGGAPGLYSARYAGGEGHDFAANNALLLKNMKDVPDGERTARFVCSVALARKGRPVLAVEGKVEGLILKALAGANGFGYDPLFFYPPLNKSFAELTPEEKNRVSHRRAALDALRRALDAENAAE